METLQKYLRIFKKLKIDRAHGNAPHKPILLISILQSIELQEVKDNQVFITPELVARFKDNWSLLVTTKHNPIFVMPFYHLSSDKIWTVITKEGDVLKYRTRSFKQFTEIVDYGMFHDELYELLLRPNYRNDLLNFLLEEYFPSTKNNFYRKNQTNESFLRKIEENLVSNSDVNIHCYDEIDEEEKFVRNGVFKKLIPKIYNYTCSISEMKIISLQDYTMIDACHIVPFNKSKDDSVSNGISLCPNLHRAFDRGLIGIDESYKVIVSVQFSEDLKNDYSLNKLVGKKLLLPFDIKLYPSKDKIKWHRDNVFQR